MNRPLLSIVVCAFERPALLKECLDSFNSHGFIYEKGLEVIVVDNSSNPSMSEKISSLVSKYPGYHYCRQSTGGLSIARNTGLKQAKGKYIGYIDDDAIAGKNFMGCLFDIIEEDKYDCFGGPIISRWPFGRPRWLSETYGNKPKLRDTRGPIKEGFNWGGNIFFKREALLSVGGFKEDIGMRGKKMGYGAENLVQIALRDRGRQIGYDPDLIVYHAVLPYKLKVSWHLKAAYVTARDGKYIFPEQYGIMGILKDVRQLFASPLRGILKFFGREGYYGTNLFMDTLRPWYVLAGKFSAIALQ